MGGVDQAPWTRTMVGRVVIAFLQKVKGQDDSRF